MVDARNRPLPFGPTYLRSGVWLRSWGIDVSGGFSVDLTKNTIYLIPFLIPFDTRVSDLGIYLELVLKATKSSIMLGIYEYNRKQGKTINLYEKISANIRDFGANFYSKNLVNDLHLPPGPYLVGVNCSITTHFRRTIQGTGSPFGSLTGGTDPFAYWFKSETFVSNSMPDTVDMSGATAVYSTDKPALYMKVNKR